MLRFATTLLLLTVLLAPAALAAPGGDFTPVGQLEAEMISPDVVNPDWGGAVGRDRSGGPDGGGYRWRDNAEAGVNYQWVDIGPNGLNGTRLNAGDDWNSGTLSLGFNFPWYGTNYDSIRVFSNGWISLDRTASQTTASLPQCPNAAAPNAIFAVNNYDLNPAMANGGGSVYFYTNRESFAVVTWDHVVQYGQINNWQTFQVILYSDGTAKYQYAALNNVNGSNSNIGWESPNGQQGMNISYRQANFLSQQLAIGIAQNFREFNGPGIRVTPAAPAFGNVYLGYERALTVRVQNVGGEELVISGLECDDGSYILPQFEEEVRLATFQTVDVQVTFRPEQEGNHDTGIRVLCNAENAQDGVFTVNVTGNALIAPEVTVNPNSFAEEIVTGEILDRTITVGNEGGSDLTFDTRVAIVAQPGRDRDSGRRIRSLGPVRVEVERDARGGPDGAGYSWRTSDEADGPDYEWIDITGVGNRLQAGDDWNSGVLNLGWNFPWYGANYSSIRVCSNGWITFDAAQSGTTISVAQAPNAAAPNNILLVNNYDLAPNLNNGQLWWWTNGRNMAVVSWISVQQYGQAANLQTFQAIIKGDGDVIYQYRDLQNVNGSNSNIGCENAAGNVGLNISYRQANFLRNNLAIGISNNWHHWITWEPGDGTIQAGGSQEIALTLDGTDLNEGDYEADLHIRSNDPATPDVTVNVTMSVLGLPIIEVVWPEALGYPDVLDFNRQYADLFAGQDFNLNFLVSNAGTSDLNVEDASCDNDYFTVTPSNFVLGPGEDQQVTVTFETAAGEAGDYNGEISLTSNDEDGVFSFAVHAHAYDPPVIGLSTNAIEVDLNSGQTADESIWVENQGDAALRWTTDMVVYQVPERDREMRRIRSLDAGPVANRDARGGPDGGDYEWRASDEWDGPDFEWIDITGNGQRLQGGDDWNSGVLNLGWNFPYYGQNYGSLRAISNGYITLDANYASALISLPQAVNAAAPNAVLAVANFDLNPNIGGAMYFWTNNQDLAVVSWENVAQYGAAGNTVKMQIVLNADGMILYQYHTLVNVNGAGQNVCWESPNGQLGMNIAYRQANFLQNEMAIGISNNWVDWISWTPEAGELAAGESQEVVVTLNAEGLFEGLYEAGLHFESNDPANPDVEVVVSLNVTGVPMIGVNWGEDAGYPDVIDWNRIYADLFINNDYAIPIVVSNDGTTDLSVGDIFCEDNHFTPDQTEFVLAPGESREVVVTFNVDDGAMHQTELVIQSNADNGNEVRIAMQGDADAPPIITLDRNWIDFDAWEGQPVQEVVNVSNDGDAVLRFTTDFELLNEPGRDRNARTIRSLAARPEVARDARGGPDGAGYEWRSSDENDGPDFDWIDITGDGQRLQGGDDWNSGVLNLGWNFPYYGQEYGSIRVISNGYITLDANYASALISLPQAVNAAAPNAVLAAANFDLNTNTGGALYYWTNNADMAVVTWESVAQFGNAGNTVKMQIVLTDDGMILYQYHTLVNVNGAGQNVCWESPNGQQGMNISYRQANFLQNEMAIGIASEWHSWLAWEPEEGELEPGADLDVTLTLDPTDLIEGDYEANVHFLSNDPENGDVSVNVVMHVVGIPDIAVEWADAAGFPDGMVWNAVYDELYTGGAYDIPLTVFNNGTADLSVGDVSSENGDFTANPAEFVIAPGNQQEVVVTLAPQEDGVHEGTLVIASNDPDRGEFEILMTGESFSPPQIALDRDAVHSDLITGQTEEHVVNVANDGGAVLNFRVEIEEIEQGRDRAIRTIRSLGPVRAEALRDARGGPDAAEYEWRSNAEGDGPNFDWIDITEIGQQLQAGDDWNSGAVNLGFDFPWYGNNYNQMRIISNGFLTFDVNYGGIGISLPQAPNAAAPNATLLVCNNDWDPSEGGEMFYWTNDQNIAVVSWIDVPEYANDNNRATFQAVLESNGMVTYQFANLQNIDGSSQSVGFESPNGQLGLNINHNAGGFLEEGMAIGISNNWVSWIAVDPDGGAIETGADLDVTVTLAAGDLPSGDYAARIHFLSNDPDDPDVTVEASISVTGEPMVETTPLAHPLEGAPENLMFPDTYLENEATIAAVITNTGTRVLAVDGVEAANDEFVTDLGAGLELAPGEEAGFNLYFRPADIGDRNGRVTISTNAINAGEGDDLGTIWFDLVGLGQYPPAIGLDPEAGATISMEMSVEANPEAATLQVSNIAEQGGDDLEWMISSEIVEPVRDQARRIVRSLDGSVGPLRDAAGGPDDMTYYWRDNDEANGPEYEWIEIVGVDGAQSFNLGDDGGTGALQLGFNFPLYGGEYGNLWACSNGWAALVQPASWPYSFAGWGQIPNATPPRAWIAPAMSDWNMNNGGDVWFWSDAEMAVVTWSQIPHINGQGDWTFQLVLYPTGFAKFQYQDTGAPDGIQLVGFQNEARDRGFEIARNARDYLTAGRAIGFGPHAAWGIPWLTVDPMEGVTGPGGSVDVSLTFDPAGLEANTQYFGLLTVESNDPVNPVLTLDVVLTTTPGGAVHFTGFGETGANHSVLVNEAVFDGSPIPSGWEIGVFTPGGALAGGDVWIDGEPLGLAVWEADDNYPDQFRAGQRMIFYFWDNDADQEFAAAPFDVQGPLNWEANAFTSLSLGYTPDAVQRVPFNAGWNLISINVTPSQDLWARQEGPDVRRMMAQFRHDNGHHLVLMKNERGQFYAPGFNDFNNIPYWNLTEGYLAKMDAAVGGVWSGQQIASNANVPIALGWNYIAYFPSYQLTCERNTFRAIAPIVNNVILAKDGGGRFASPRNNFSNMPPWAPGRGYQINVNAAVTLNYLDDGGRAAALPVEQRLEVIGPWSEPEFTSENMSVLISAVGIELKDGDAVAAFDASGKLVGLGRAEGGRVGLAVWGDDPSTETVDGLVSGGSFELRWWSSETDEIKPLAVAGVETGAGAVYETDGFTAVSASVARAIPDDYYLSQNYPNPFNAVTRVAFGLPEAAIVSVKVYDLAGRVVATLAEGRLEAGHHVASWDGAETASGVYLVKLESPVYSATFKAALLK